MMPRISGYLVLNIAALIYTLSTLHGRYMLARAAKCSGSNVIDGDILSDIKPGRSRRAATSKEKKLWPKGVIPYVIADDFKNETKDLIRAAMDHWQGYTCLDFVKRTNQKDYIYIFSGSGSQQNISWQRVRLFHSAISTSVSAIGCSVRYRCCSFVGRRGGKQKLSLGLGCDTFGIIVHELGHSVGFWHEQSRPDRDNYVKILYENILQKDKHNFKKLGDDSINSRQQRYDFHSIMHYGSDFFAKKGGVDTIVPKLRGIKKEELGKQYYSRYTFALSNQDVIQTNLMYRCNIFNENGGTIFAKSGSFHSPNYPLPYSVSRDRVWIITNGQSNGSSLTLSFDDFSVGSNDGTGICKNDYLDIRNGKGFLSQYLTQLCGNEKPDPITLLGESIYIRLHSQLLNHKSPEIKKGFSLRFKTDECSQKMTSMQDSFSTPNFPVRYNSNTDCVWQIQVPKGYRIKITFKTFHLQGVDNKKGCLDYVDLRDGDSPFSTFFGRFCGNNNPGVVTSTSTSFRVIFHSSSPHNETSAVGFRASYETVDIDECAEKLSECEQACINTKGSYLCGCRAGYSFISGLYGTCVDRNECEDNNGGCSHGCENTDGSYYCTCPEGHYLVQYGKVCTDIDECALKPCAHTCRNYVGGFECLCNEGYKMNDDQRTCRDINECLSSPCPQTCINTEGSFKCVCNSGSILDKNTNSCKVLPSCGGILSESSGEISSPLLPRPLPHDIECFWNIRVPRATHMNINVMVAWRRDQKCSNHILIRYTTDDNENTVKICGKGDLVRSLAIRSNDVWIKYHIETARKSEMSLRYTSSTKESQCKKTLTGATGTIKTPGFPSKYPANTRCEWRIKNTVNRRLRLKFDFFDIERERSCKYDYLDITLRTSDRRYSRSIGKFCGSVLGRVFRIDPGRELILVFKSDSTIHRHGFHAEFKTVRN